MRHLRPTDYRVMPWKDGGGSTTEIAIEPAGSSLTDRFLWRVSFARIEASGPFSPFPGYQRTLALLDGAGMILNIEGQARQWLKDRRKPVVFPGGSAVNATLIQGPCLDFGVISDPTRVETTLQVLTLGPDATSILLAPTTLLFAPQGLVAVDPLKIHLDPMESLLLDRSDAARVGLRASQPGTPLLVVSFSPMGR